MIILFEENETEFSSLGLGVLKDAISCVVEEELNETFTLEMEYPITGNHFKELRMERIICCKPNPYASSKQPFRIKSISKPINGIVTVSAVHISYDMNDVPVTAVDCKNIQDAITQIQNACVLENNFTWVSNMTSSKSFKTTAPYNMRAILLGGDESLLKVYDAEVEFDQYNIIISSKRGHDRGAKVVYGSNMTDLNHEVNDDLLYNGVFPYYHTEQTSVDTTNNDGEFTKAYIVGSKPFQSNWLSYTENGEAFTPVDGADAVQIATEGDYEDKVYVWSESRGRYIEKIYNEQVTLIEGVTNPSWITIDWSSFPKVVCRAAKKGYFKKMTDEDWEEKGVGDVIFEGNLLTTGILGTISENMIIYFSEIIPSTSDKETETVSEIVDVQLDDKIIWLTTSDATNMKHNRILSLDLTSEFDEEPTKEKLRSKAEEYISKNKIGTVKHTTTVSFIDLTKTTEDITYENFDKVELGDTVQVKYEDLGVDVSLRVISYSYNVLTDSYDSVELGEKEDSLSGSTIQNGDSISSLTNDAGYADITTVNKLIAKQVTADYLEAVNAKMSKAQIKQLETERISCSGIIEASQFTLDKLVANMLIAENAEISKTLTAGNIKVSGDIDIKSGAIKIANDDDGTTFSVDRNGNVKANSVEITGGTFNINDGVFYVDSDGTLYAENANIEGTIKSEHGEIGGFSISGKCLYSDELGKGIYLSKGIEGIIKNLSEEIKTWAIAVGDKFGVTTDGTLYAKKAIIEGGGKIAGFTVGTKALYAIDEQLNGYVYLGTDFIALGGTEEEPNFKVDKTGKIEINEGSIKLGPKKMFEEYKATLINDISEIYNDGYYVIKTIDEVGVEIITLYYHYKGSISGIEETKEMSYELYNHAPTELEWEKNKVYLYPETISDDIKYRVFIGSYNHKDNNFSVNKEGKLVARQAEIGDQFSVDEDGNTHFSGFTVTIDEETEVPALEYSQKTDYVHIGPDKIALGKDTTVSDPNFVVDNKGNLKSKNTEITGYLKAGETSKDSGEYNFVLNNYGEIKMGGKSGYSDVYNIVMNTTGANFFYTMLNRAYGYVCTIDSKNGLILNKGSLNLGIVDSNEKFNFYEVFNVFSYSSTYKELNIIEEDKQKVLTKFSVNILSSLKNILLSDSITLKKANDVEHIKELGAKDDGLYIIYSDETSFSDAQLYSYTSIHVDKGLEPANLSAIVISGNWKREDITETILKEHGANVYYIGKTDDNIYCYRSYSKDTPEWPKGYSYYNGKLYYNDGTTTTEITNYILVESEPTVTESIKLLDMFLLNGHTTLWICIEYNLKSGYNYIKDREAVDFIYYMTDYYYEKIEIEPANPDPNKAYFSYIDHDIPTKAECLAKSNNHIFVTRKENNYIGPGIYLYTYQIFDYVNGYNYNEKENKIIYYIKGSEPEIIEDFELVDQEPTDPTKWIQNKIFLYSENYSKLWKCETDNSYNFTVTNNGDLSTRTLNVTRNNVTFLSFNEKENKLGRFIFDGTDMKYVDIDEGTEEQNYMVYISTIGSKDYYSIAGSSSVKNWLTIFGGGFGVRYNKTQKVVDGQTKTFIEYETWTENIYLKNAKLSGDLSITKGNRIFLGDYSYLDHKSINLITDVSTSVTLHSSFNFEGINMPAVIVSNKFFMGNSSGTGGLLFYHGSNPGKQRKIWLTMDTRSGSWVSSGQCVISIRTDSARTTPVTYTVTYWYYNWGDCWGTLYLTLPAGSMSVSHTIGGYYDQRINTFKMIIGGVEYGTVHNPGESTSKYTEYYSEGVTTSFRIDSLSNIYPRNAGVQQLGESTWKWGQGWFANINALSLYAGIEDENVEAIKNYLGNSSEKILSYNDKSSEWYFSINEYIKYSAERMYEMQEEIDELKELLINVKKEITSLKDEIKQLKEAK